MDLRLFQSSGVCCLDFPAAAKQGKEFSDGCCFNGSNRCSGDFRSCFGNPDYPIAQPEEVVNCRRAYNRSKNVLIASEVEETANAWKRMRGLIGLPAEKFSAGKGLWIIPSQGIHTIGMSFPIDAAYLDRKGRVIKLYHRLPPFRVAALMFKARSVLELPAGTLAHSQTEVGDILEITPEQDAKT